MSTEKSLTGLLLIVGVSKTADMILQRVTSRGYHVEVTMSARDAVSRVSIGEVSTILLDLTSGQASLDLADTLMGLPACPPIVVLDAAPTIERVVSALRIGVADYLSMSDSESEVIDRLTAQLAKSQTEARMAPSPAEIPMRANEQNGASRLPGLDLNAARRMLIIEDVPVLLSSIELNLIEALIEHRGDRSGVVAGERRPLDAERVEHADGRLGPQLDRVFCPIGLG